MITEVKGNQAKLWLGGIDVDAIAPGTVFNIINGQGKLTLQSRDSANGLIGVGTVPGVAEEGALLKAEGLSTGR